MALERTLSIIKPDAVAKNVIGEIYSRFEKAGLKVVAAKMKHLSRKEAEGFYAVHRERPFFNALVEFMISGPVMIQVLEGENAVAEEPRPDGRHQSEGRRAGHDPRRLRRSRSTPMPCTVRTAGERRDRNRVLLRRHRGLPALIATHDDVTAGRTDRERGRRQDRTCSTSIARAWSASSPRRSARSASAPTR